MTMAALTLLAVPGPGADGLAMELRAAGLPADDLDRPGRLFFRLEDGAGTAGHGGLELYGADALLRSLVVPAARRGGGTGRILAAALEDEARRRGAGRLWLLTTSAAGFFEALGYRRTGRADAPPAIAGSAQFAGLCPASAVCMVKPLA